MCSTKRTNNGQPVNPLIQLFDSGKREYISTKPETILHYDVFLDSDIEEPCEYRDLISLLFNASEQDTVTLFINSSGGHLDTALAIIEGLKHTLAHVTAVLIGQCHSAASIISMYAHEVIVLDSANSMIHTASFGTAGNTGNVKSFTDFTVKQVESLLNETYEGFLTKDELAKIKQGVEIWLTAEEIRERMISRIKFIKSKSKKEDKKSNTTRRKKPVDTQLEE